MKYDTLYKKTSTGAIQVWWMEQDGSKYRTTSGQIDGQKVTTEYTQAVGKNKGKKNETSDESQATAEILAQYKKKLAQGNYKENIEDIDEDNFFKPMLANKYEDRPPSKELMASGKVFSQPKLDGVRCIVTKDGMFTRQGKQIISAPHIFESVKSIFQQDPTFIIDGELYNHQLRDNFNEIISLCRQSKPTAEDLEKSKNMIEYHVYDFPCNLPFIQRMSGRVNALFSIPTVKIVPTDQVFSQEQMNQLYMSYLENGFEGQMIRISENGYENKRTNQLLKRKEFQDAEFDIVQIEEGTGNRAGMAGAITYKLPDGRLFRSGIKGGVDFYREVLINAKTYEGGQGTVKFFQYTPDGVPRFPVTTALFPHKRDI